MEVSVGWSIKSNCAGYRTIQEIVSDAVMFFRNRGHNRTTAIEQAALALGMTQRKTRSIFYGEAFTLLDCEIRRVRAAFLTHLDQQADDLARRSEEARARRRQFELEI